MQASFDPAQPAIIVMDLSYPNQAKWRFVVDYKNIKSFTKASEKWPLPNIKEILSRLGDKHPKYMAFMDLTSE